MKPKFVKDDERLEPYVGRLHLYKDLTPEQLFEINPGYLLWLKNNNLTIRFSDGIRKKLNKYRKNETKRLV
jgi:hypothetical protein